MRVSEKKKVETILAFKWIKFVRIHSFPVEEEHWFWNPEISEATRSVDAPLEVSLRHDGALASKNSASSIDDYRFLETVAFHIHTVRGINFAASFEQSSRS